jgi:crossover junction endodeoxyribonuclease RusA
MSAAQTQQRIVLTLPHPPASLSPNGRAHWRRKAADAKQTRNDAYISCLIADADKGWPAATMHIFWQFAGKQPDDDNVIARCKPIRDGIADAGLVADDGLIRVTGVTFERVPRKDQGVVLTLTREDVT